MTQYDKCPICHEDMAWEHLIIKGGKMYHYDCLIGSVQKDGADKQ